jgi:hypothetical protein
MLARAGMERGLRIGGAMSSDSHGMEISDFELRSLTNLMHPPSMAEAADDWESPPADLDEAGRAKWRAEQEERREAKWRKRREEADARQKQAESEFKAALDEKIKKAYEQGSANAVSREALRAISVRSYVLLGVVAAVVAMPLIGMLLHLDPQAFGAYIAPVTGITGTIVGYWFGTVGQGTTGPQTVPPSRRRTPTT